jgi:hypothetical protein
MPGKNGRFGSWTAWGSLLLALVLASLSAAFLFGGRTPTPEQRKREARTEAEVLMLRELEEPKEQIAKIETKVVHIEEDVKEIKGLVKEIRDNQ